MNVRFTETAYAVVQRIEATSRQIGMFPEIGPQKYRFVRMFPVGRFPYLIFYAIENDEVVVLTIRHSSRRPLSDEDF